MASQVIYFVTVDNNKAQAEITFGTVIQDLYNSYDLIHVANCERINAVKTVLQSLVTPPQLLITSSDWFEEEQEEVRETTRRLYPDIHLIMVPPGLHKQIGEQKVVEYLKEQIQELRLPLRAERGAES
ncbi:hypothetical protein B0O99DRAFT_683651 [Bisporella sp. PMI_857]|nr:hypothetical protein B0O99DRAFT_683651 [Bisporella sp. PMI_857]